MALGEDIITKPLAPLTGNGPPPVAAPPTPAVSAETPKDELSEYEQNILTETHAGEALSDRLSRLETYIFGEPQSGDPASRQARLIEVLKASAVQKVQDAPVAGVNESPSQPDSEKSYVVPPSAPAKPDATDYPTVTSMERNVFGKDFRSEAIQQRLDRLETKMFNRTYPDRDLVDRVDTLSSKVPSFARAKDFVSDGPVAANTQSPIFNSSKNGDIYLKLDVLERFNFNGQTYPGKLLSERVDSLEKKNYGSVFSGEAMEKRLNRLMTTLQNQLGQNQPGNGDSASYQENPMTQSRPQIQPSPSSSYNNSVPDRRRQNVQIGSGMSSSSSYQYSQEMLDMLPRDIRNQLQGNATSSMVGSSAISSSGMGSSSLGSWNTRRSSGYTTSAPGTVIIQEERTMSYPGGLPGFSTFSQQPMQYRNYYSVPGVQSGLGGTPLNNLPQNAYPQVYPQAMGIPQAMAPYGGLPSGGYTVDPAVLQQLNNLEINMFGQVNAYAPVPLRLNQLEATLLGQNFTGYSDADRINNLQRAYQLQSVGRSLGNGKLGQMGRTAGSMLFGVPMPAPAK